MKRLAKKRRSPLPVVLCIAAAAALALVLWLCLRGGAKSPWNTQPVQLEAGHGLQIVESGSYTGPYWEDGSDEPVENVRAIVVRNPGDQDLQYARLTLTYPDGQAEFAVTNLPAGESAVVLEYSRMVACEELPVEAAAENVVLLDGMPLHEETFSVVGGDNMLTVTNISAEDISGDVYVYYKTMGEGIYHGGITYRTRFAGGIEAGEACQEATQHYHPDTSKIVMITYGE